MKRRYSDNDKHIGPITISKNGNWKPLALTINSGYEESPGCCLRIAAAGWTAHLELPTIIKPWRRWVPTGHYHWAKSPDDGYWDEHAREYGLQLSDNFLQLFYGPQTHSSETTKSRGYFLPWSQWRFARCSFYAPDGRHFWSEVGPKVPWEEMDKQRQACPTKTFKVKDYDGEVIDVTCRLEEREWHLGEGAFRWLSWFVKPKIRRSVDLAFSSELGPEKGSWKGGTLGHSTDIAPGEDIETALRRYCAEEHRSKYRKFKITFIEENP